MPKVSVIMPVHNCERYLAEGIECILGQTLEDLELIIVNDGSTDRSREIAVAHSDPRITLVDNGGNLGLSASLNHGIRVATGQYLARQDADDLSHPDRLRRQVEFLEQHPDVGLVGTRVEWIDTRGRRLRVSTSALTCAQIRWAHLFQSAGISGATAVFRREVVEQVGAYHPEFRYSNDSEFHARVVRRFGVANLPDPLYVVRVHEQQITFTYGDTPRCEAERLVLANMRELLEAVDASGQDPDVHAEDLIALSALYTLAPEHLDRLASPKVRWLLGRLLDCFRRANELAGPEWDEFRAWLSRDWLVAANVHLADRPALALWLWWRALRLRWANAVHSASLRLLPKVLGYPAYRAWRTRSA